MTLVRRIVGIVLLLTGIGGLAASVLAILAVRQASQSMPAQTSELLGSTKEAVGYLKRGTTNVQSLLVEAKDRVQALDGALAAIDKRVKDSPAKKSPLDALDDKLVRQLHRAQTTLNALQSTLQGFHNALVLFNSLPGFARAAPSGSSGNEGQNLSRTLSDASEALDQISHFLNDALTNREVTLKSLGEVMVWVDQIQRRLVDSEQQVDRFKERLEITVDRLASAEKAAPHWIEQGSLVVVVFLICFACTQFGLVVQGICILRKKIS